MLNLTTDLRFINEPEIDFEYYFLIKIIASIELIAEILTIFHVLYVLIIFIQIRVCHAHFWFLSCLFLVDLILKTVANMVVLTKFITGITFLRTSTDYFIANIIQLLTNYAYYFVPLAIFAERTMSLIWSKSYEKCFSILFVMAFLSVPFTAVVYLTVHLFYLQYWMPINTVYMIANTCLISSWLMYFIVYYFSKKRKISKIQTVSERYQRFENSRTHATMYWFALTCIISILCGTAYIHFLRYYKLWFPNISEINMTALVRLLLDTIQAYLLLILPITFAFTHERLKKKYLQIFKCCKAPNTITSEMEMQIKSITGQNMIFKDEQEFYFRSLITEWEGKCDQKVLEVSNIQSSNI